MSYIIIGNPANNAEYISREHFGINFVANFERIGEQGWETFDETVSNVGAQNLRYPGGSYSENFFNLQDPNASEYYASDGSLQRVEPLSDFLLFCQRNNNTATIIIPTLQLLTSENYGMRQFNQSLIDDLYGFVWDILSSPGGENVTLFEIGNEYETYMTSSEYGRVASIIAEVTQSAIDDFRHINGLSMQWQEPQIAVQSWSFNVQNSLTIEEQSQRNQAVMNEFDFNQINAVDAIVSHYYFDINRYLGEDTEQTYQNLEIAMLHSIDILNEWGDNFNRPFDLIYSEWSTFHLSENLIGLAQLPAIIAMFETMTGNGVDALNFWSAQYHASSLALSNGLPTAAGVLFDFMSSELIGYQALDVDTDLTDVELAGFSNGEYTILFLSSIIDESSTISLSAESSLLGYYLVNALTITSNLDYADGSYRNLHDLPSSLEPDLPGLLIDYPIGNEWFLEDQDLTLSPHQTIILVLSNLITNFEMGTSSDDIFYYEPEVNNYNGLDGFDTMSFELSEQGVVVDLMNDILFDGTPIFESIESVIGSNYADVIRSNNVSNALDGGDGNDTLVCRDGDDHCIGGTGDDLIYGGNGHDKILGGLGNDRIFGQAGDDVIDAGSGNDVIYAGAGDDTILYSSGSDQIWGEAGFDTLDLSTNIEGVSVYGNQSTAVVSGGNIEFYDIDRFIFGSGDDRLDVHWTGNTIAVMGPGFDFVTVNGRFNEISLGDGDDLLYNSGENNLIHCGDGNDRVFSYAGLATIEGGLGDDIIYLHGDGNVLNFANGDGHDIVVNFDPEYDILALNPSLISLLSSGSYNVSERQDTTILNFGQNQGSIEFVSLSIDQFSIIIDNILEMDNFDFF